MAIRFLIYGVNDIQLNGVVATARIRRCSISRWIAHRAKRWCYLAPAAVKLAAACINLADAALSTLNIAGNHCSGPSTKRFAICQ